MRKDIYIYILIGCFIFIFSNKKMFSEDIEMQLKQSIVLKNLCFSAKNKLVEIEPEDGFIIKVSGTKEKKIIIVLNIKEENNGIKIVELKPEKKVIKLDKNGEGVFKIGALIAVKNILQPGTHYSKVRAGFKYLN